MSPKSLNPKDILNPRLIRMIEAGIKCNAGFEAIVMAMIIRCPMPIMHNDVKFRRIADEIGYDISTHFSQLIYFMEIYRYWMGQSINFKFINFGANLDALRWVDGFVVRLMEHYRVRNDSVATSEVLLPLLVIGLEDIFYPHSRNNSCYWHCCPGLITDYGGYYYLDGISLGFPTQAAESDMIIGVATHFTINHREHAFIKFATRIPAEKLCALSNHVEITRGEPSLCYDPEQKCVVEQQVVEVYRKPVLHYKVKAEDQTGLDAFRKLHLTANEVFLKMEKLYQMLSDSHGEPTELRIEFKKVYCTRQELSRLDQGKLDELSERLKDIKVRFLQYLAEKDSTLTPLVNLEQTGEVDENILGALKELMNGGPRT